MKSPMVVSIYKKDEVAIFDTADTTSVSGYHQQPIDNTLIQSVFQEIQQIAAAFTCPVDSRQHQTTQSQFRISPENLSEFSRLGRIIYTQCIPQSVRVMLEHSSSQELILRMDARLMDIPWEIAFNGNHYLSMRFCLSRQILIANPSTELSKNVSKNVSYPIKILIIADPSGTLSSVDQEVEILMDMLDNMSHFQVEVIGGSRATRLNILKLIEIYDIVHFAGHSAVDPNRPDQRGWRLSDGFLSASDFNGLNNPPMLVFSNSCASAATGQCVLQESTSIGDLGMGGGFLLAGVRHFIGALWVIHDAASAEFARYVYQELLNGKSIGKACLTARQECMRQHPELIPVWSAYVHYGNPSDILMPVPECQPPATMTMLFPPQVQSSGYRRRKLFLTIILLIILMAAGIGIAFFMWSPSLQQSSLDKPVEKAPVIDPLSSIYTTAIQDYQNHRIDKAIAMLVRLTDKPENTTGIGVALLSEIYREAGLNQQAETFLNRALAKNSSDPYLLILKGEQLWASGDISGADGCFRQAAESPVADPPDRARALNSRGVLTFLRGNSQSAKLFFEAALQAHPKDMDAPFNLAFLSYCQKDYSAANRYLEPVLKQSPEDAMVCELRTLLNAPLSAIGPQIADRSPYILVIPPILSYGQLNRLGMDRILSEKMVTLLIPQYPNMLIKQALPVYGQDYSLWRQDMDSGWLTLRGQTDAGVSQQIIMGEFGQTLHTLTVTIRWILIDSGQVIFNQTFHGDGPDKINLLLSDWVQAVNKQALARFLR
jgi:CHAT domain-containing protein/Flp pilus assembly protein TadD